MSQFPVPAQHAQSLHFPASVTELHGRVNKLHITGVESLDMSEGGEDGELPKPADQIHALVGDLGCYRDVTIVYEIPEIKSIDDLARSYQNLRYYLDLASNLYAEDELEKLAELLQEAYRLHTETDGGVKFAVKYIISNNVFGLRVELEIGAPLQKIAVRKTSCFIFNPQHF